MRKFHKERGLTYLTSVILLKNPSPEEEHDKYGQLFDPTEYTIDRFSSDLYGEASEKANKILEQFGEYIEKVCIITRDNSIGDTPKITMYELSDGCEILYSEDWSKFIPSDYIIAASDSEIEGNGRAELKIEKTSMLNLKVEKKSRIEVMTVSIQHQFNGQRLKEARMYRGMTLEELKEKIGVSKQMISKYEQNISAPTPEILFSLLQALRFPKEFFLFFE